MRALIFIPHFVPPAEAGSTFMNEPYPVLKRWAFIYRPAARNCELSADNFFLTTEH
jgi:hypothetical protein